MDQKFNQLEKYLSDFTNRISCQEEMIRVLWGELAVQSKTMKKLEIKRQDKMKTIELLNTRECIVNNLKTKIERQDELINELQKRRDEQARHLQDLLEKEKQEDMVEDLNVKLDAQKDVIERLEKKVDEQSDVLLYLQSQDNFTSKEQFEFEMTFEKFMNMKRLCPDSVDISFPHQVEICLSVNHEVYVEYGEHSEKIYIKKDAVSGRYECYRIRSQTDKEILKLVGLKNLKISAPDDFDEYDGNREESFWLNQYIEENRNHMETLSIDMSQDWACELFHEEITLSNLKMLSLEREDLRLGNLWCPKIEKLEMGDSYFENFIMKHGHLIRNLTMSIHWLGDFDDEFNYNFGHFTNLKKLVIVDETTVDPTTHQNDHNLLFFKFAGDQNTIQYKRNELVNLPEEIQISAEEIQGKYPVVVHRTGAHFDLGYQIQSHFIVTKDLEVKLKAIDGSKIYRRNRNIYFLKNNE